MSWSIDHIGIVVPDLEATKSKLDIILKGVAQETHDMPEDGIRIVAYRGLNDKENITIELISRLPGAEKSVIDGFLSKKGGGIHHVALRTGRGKLDEVVQRLKEAGLQFVGEPKESKVSGCRVIWLHPKSTGGVLIELLDK